MKFLRKIIIYISIFFPVYKGFKVSEAVKYFGRIFDDFTRSRKFGVVQKLKAYKMGYLPQIAQRFGICKKNAANFVSQYDYHYIYPVNDIFTKWFEDRVTTRNVLKPFKEYLPEFYYHIYIRDLEPMIIRLADCPEGFSDDFDGILDLIKAKGKVCFARKKGNKSNTIKFENETFYFDGAAVTEEQLIEIIKKDIKKDVRVITEFVENCAEFSTGIESKYDFIRLTVYNKYADNPQIGQASICVNRLKDSGTEETDGYYYLPVDVETGTYNGGKCLSANNVIKEMDFDPVSRIPFAGEIVCWSEIKDVIRKMGLFIPQIELVGVDVVLTEDGFKFINFTDHPEYPEVVYFNDEMRDYFALKASQKREQAKLAKSKKINIGKIFNSFIWTVMSKVFCPPEMSPLIYKWWFVTVRDDLFSRNGISLKDKLWAYKMGFLSYRLPQYGITRDNFRNFISDYDYRYIRHINNEYRTWLEDKLTVKYICSEYSQYFPAYYYHFSVRNGEKRLIPLMDLPEYCDNNPESIFTLVEKIGALACKPQKGSQGQGFYKFSYEDGKYYLNHEEVTKEQVLEILDDGTSQYFVTEYIQQHHVINSIYSGAVNTMRIITFMKDGKNPEIGNAYMRFGSKKTGAVDNMGAGGMFAQVDMETGRFYNGKIITENSIEPCSQHPDTGELIEGYLPNWDIIKDGIIKLSLEMPQLEYLGFDVAITEDGMKLPEINRAPGYPKIETFNRATNDYLLYKREMKMKKHNIAKTKW